MPIISKATKLHWNYFLALERDMETVSRYVEFSDPNMEVYSLELAHLLFAAASEVDVIAKLICEQVAPQKPRTNITEYQGAIVPALPDLPNADVFVPRYELSLKPWSNWSSDHTPDWWRSYNKVKHERDAHFDQATLKNALNALSGLLVLTFHYYSRKLASPGQTLGKKETTELLTPDSTLFRLPDDYYYYKIVAG